MRNISISTIVGVALLTSGGITSAAEEGYIGNFEGFYAGVLTGFAPAGNNNRYHVGVLGGHRWVFSDQFVIGAELQSTFGLDTFWRQYVDASASVHAGMIVGDNILLYAKAGLGVETYVSFSTYNAYTPIVGAGAELAVNDYVNLRFEVIAELNYPILPDRPVRGAEFNFGVVANLD